MRLRDEAGDFEKVLERLAMRDDLILRIAAELIARAVNDDVEATDGR